jgi:serine/threonine-protein kinase RIO1
MLRLYTVAQLVHADLSEHNILVCSPDNVENSDKNTTGEGENFQIVLIDFVQAVDISHPKAQEYLERDMDQLRQFFTRKGIKALGKGMAVLFVTGSDKILPDQGNSSTSQDTLRKSNDDTAVPLKKLRSVNSVSSKSTQSSGSRLKNGMKGKQKISARSISTNSVSTKSSLSSMSPVKLHAANQDQFLSASLIASQECFMQSLTEKTPKKERKEKKSKKEKKEKKKKKDKLKDSSNKTVRSNDDSHNRQSFNQNTFPVAMETKEQRNPGEVTENQLVASHSLFSDTSQSPEIYSESLPDLQDPRWEETWNSEFKE